MGNFDAINAVLDKLSFGLVFLLGVLTSLFLAVATVITTHTVFSPVDDVRGSFDMANRLGFGVDIRLLCIDCGLQMD